MLDLRFSRGTLALRPFAHWNYRLRHITMAAGIADIIEQAFDQVASVGASKAMVTHRDNQVRPQLAGDRDPLDTLELQTEIRNLYNQIVALDRAQINRNQAVADLQPAHRMRQRARKLQRQLRAVNLPQQVVVGQRIKMDE